MIAYGGAWLVWQPATSCWHTGCYLCAAQGDAFAAAACGLTTGHVHAHHQSTAQQADSTSDPHILSRSDWGFAARGLSSEDVDRVEQHMLRLLQLPGVLSAGGSNAAGPGSSDDAAIERQLQFAGLKVSAYTHGAMKRAFGAP